MAPRYLRKGARVLSLSLNQGGFMSRPRIPRRDFRVVSPEREFATGKRKFRNIALIFIVFCNYCIVGPRGEIQSKKHIHRKNILHRKSAVSAK